MDPKPPTSFLFESKDIFFYASWAIIHSPVYIFDKFVISTHLIYTDEITKGAWSQGALQEGDNDPRNGWFGELSQSTLINPKKEGTTLTIEGGGRRHGRDQIHSHVWLGNKRWNRTTKSLIYRPPAQPPHLYCPLITLKRSRKPGYSKNSGN